LGRCGGSVETRPRSIDSLTPCSLEPSPAPESRKDEGARPGDLRVPRLGLTSESIILVPVRTARRAADFATVNIDMLSRNQSTAASQLQIHREHCEPVSLGRTHWHIARPTVRMADHLVGIAQLSVCFLRFHTSEPLQCLPVVASATIDACPISQDCSCAEVMMGVGLAVADCSA